MSWPDGSEEDSRKEKEKKRAHPGLICPHSMPPRARPAASVIADPSAIPGRCQESNRREKGVTNLYGSVNAPNTFSASFQPPSRRLLHGLRFHEEPPGRIDEKPHGAKVHRRRRKAVDGRAPHLVESLKLAQHAGRNCPRGIQVVEHRPGHRPPPGLLSLRTNAPAHRRLQHPHAAAKEEARCRRRRRPRRAYAAPLAVPRASQEFFRLLHHFIRLHRLACSQDLVSSCIGRRLACRVVTSGDDDAGRTQRGSEVRIAGVVAHQ
jgi:hypothetical protein